jgi:hypothetical protein
MHGVEFSIDALIESGDLLPSLWMSLRVGRHVGAFGSSAGPGEVSLPRPVGQTARPGPETIASSRRWVQPPTSPMIAMRDTGQAQSVYPAVRMGTTFGAGGAVVSLADRTSASRESARRRSRSVSVCM